MPRSRALLAGVALLGAGASGLAARGRLAPRARRLRGEGAQLGTPVVWAYLGLLPAVTGAFHVLRVPADA